MSDGRVVWGTRFKHRLVLKALLKELQCTCTCIFRDNASGVCNLDGGVDVVETCFPISEGMNWSIASIRLEVLVRDKLLESNNRVVDRRGCHLRNVHRRNALVLPLFMTARLLTSIGMKKGHLWHRFSLQHLVKCSQIHHNTPEQLMVL